MIFKNTRNKFSQVCPNLWLAMHQQQVKNYKNPSIFKSISKHCWKKSHFLFVWTSRKKNNVHNVSKNVHLHSHSNHPSKTRERKSVNEAVGFPQDCQCHTQQSVQSVPASCVSTWARQGDVSMPHLLVCSHEKEVVGGKLSGACHNVPLQDPPRSFSAGVPLHHILLYFSPPPTALPARALLCAPCHYA